MGGTPFLSRDINSTKNETTGLDLTQAREQPQLPNSDNVSLPMMLKDEEEKSSHKKLQNQSSVVSSDAGVALSGTNKLSLGFYNLNSDF